MPLSTPDRYRRKSTIDFSESISLTEQCHKDECSIQNIMKKYKKTGILNHTNEYQGTYMDMTNALDYHEAQNIIAAASSMFETVPAHIRKHFNNDSSQFVDFMQNPDNKSQIEEMGLSTSHLPSDKQTPKPNPTPSKPSKTSEKGNEEQLEIPTSPSDG